ncbi:MAG: hypothetical protein QOJ09_729 [Actinomycetota bacterium]|jgi:hypothetical protein|nr:hypothetical protein [Actinomycetota bacterium]
MLPVVLVLLGLFIAGYALVTLERGVGLIVGGCSLVALSMAAALIPLSPAAPAPTPTFTMDVSAR